MKISAKADYACLAMLALARHGQGAPPLRIRDISEAYSIPERYLVQILLQLKSAGFVVSTRGASGGYHLARPAAAIKLGDILSVIDGPNASERAAPRRNQPAARVLASVWDRVRAAEHSVLNNITLAELAAEAAPLEWII
jgi:Rrf2 family protein